jgi:signal transduction histidine kinase
MPAEPSQADSPDMATTVARNSSTTPGALLGAAPEVQALPAAAASADGRLRLLRMALWFAAFSGWLLIAVFGLQGFGEWQTTVRLAALLLLGVAIALWAEFEAAQQFRLASLADTAAAGERRRISLDLHDSAIQPYLGLRLGLEALRRRMDADNPLARDIDELFMMTQDSIAELRGYVRVLGGRPTQEALLDGLRRQVERFRGFYGLDVELDVAADVEVDERLSDDIVRMVGEGLSNVGRHTESHHATISLSRAARRLELRIADDGAGDPDAWQRFTPVSLTLRAQRLRGSVTVEPRRGGGSTVWISIPV